MSWSFRTFRTVPGQPPVRTSLFSRYRRVLPHVSTVVRSLVSGTAGMLAGQRRRADAVLLAIALLLVGVAAAVGVMVGATERITGLWIGAEISSDGQHRDPPGRAV